MKLTKNTIAIVTGLVLVSLIVLLNAQSEGFLSRVGDRLEWFGYDLRMRWDLKQHPRDRDELVVIVDIDEKSLKEEGHWPWPRNKIARLIETLFNNQAAVVGLDMMFPEYEQNPVDTIAGQLKINKADAGQDLQQQLEGLRSQFDNDSKLAAVIAKHPVVLGYTFSNRSGESNGQLPPPQQIELESPVLLSDLYELRTYTANNDAVQNSTRYAGSFNVTPDDDGVIRKSALLYNFDGKIYSSLALEIARLYQGGGPINLSGKILKDRLSLAELETSGMKIAVDSQASVNIPYRGKQGSYLYLSATDILNGNFDRDKIADAVILIGTTAEGLYDLRSTPVESVYAGVEIHANLITALLASVPDVPGSEAGANPFPHEPYWVKGAYIAELIGIGVLIAFIFPFLPPTSIAILSIVLIAAHNVTSIWLWQTHLLVYPVTLASLLIFILGVWNLLYGFRKEHSSRKILVNRFGQYVPPALVTEMNSDPAAEFGLNGESREMTVLFADIRSFTTISESLKANELKMMLNYFFTPMTGIIFNQRGTIDKYVGDMIMAFWGAPLHDPDHRGNAIKAALDMLQKVTDMQDELKQRGWPPINIGIGLNTGDMNVGDMGSEFRRAYTVIGDAVNLGSRLEGLTKFYGVGLIVSETTREAQDQFIYRKLDRVRVKGKNEAVEIYEPVCLREQASEELLDEVGKLEQGLESYYKQDWPNAVDLFTQLNKAYPDRIIYSMYLDRIAELSEKHQGIDWDGVFTHTSK